MAKRIVVALGLLATLIVAGGAAYIWFSGGSGEPSVPITAPPIATQPTVPDTSAPPITTSEAPATTEAPTAVVYRISQEESVAEFRIGEILRGSPNQVVGTTDQVAAELLVDLTDPPSAQLGDVVINARTFSTDSSFRDRAIRSFILESASDEFEFITFTPTSIEGLPSSLGGGPITFTVAGDLTIRTVTQAVSFEVALTEATAERIGGRATATVMRSDFDLRIPNVQSVAGVEEEIELVLEFVALPFE